MTPTAGSPHPGCATLVWHIVRRPRGLVPGAIQYGHLHVQMTLGYAKVDRNARAVLARPWPRDAPCAGFAARRGAVPELEQRVLHAGSAWHAWHYRCQYANVRAARQVT